MDYKKETIKTLNDYNEDISLRNYNRYITKDLSSIPNDTVQTVYIEDIQIYIVYVNETFEEVYNKWKEKNKQELS